MKLIDLNEEKIEHIMGLGPNVVPFRALAPMFDGKGQPLLKEDGTQLCLSYTHAAVYDAYLLERFGVSHATSTEEVKHLPLLFSCSTAVHLLTADRCALFGMRSNFSSTLPGALLSLAGGFSKVIDKKAETIIACAWRELAEETCLREKDIDGEMHHFGMNMNPIISYEIGEQNLPGRVLDLETQLVIKSGRRASDLAKRIRLSDEHIGTVRVSLDRLPAHQGRWGEWSDKVCQLAPLRAPATFYPAEELLRRMTYRNRSGALIDLVHKNMPLKSLKNDLPFVCKPQEILDETLRPWQLGEGIRTIVDTEDFRTNQGNAEPLIVIERAARHLGLLAPAA